MLIGENSRKVSQDVAKKLAEIPGITFTQPDPAPFREASKKIYDQFLKTDKERELLAMVLAD